MLAVMMHDTARSPPVLGSGAVVVLVVTEGLSGSGRVVRVISISKASQELSYTVTRCLRVRPDLGFGFGVGVPESWVGLDGASASGLLRRLNFCIQYLAIGGGRITGCNGETVDLDEGDRHE